MALYEICWNTSVSVCVHLRHQKPEMSCRTLFLKKERKEKKKQKKPNFCHWKITMKNSKHTLKWTPEMNTRWCPCISATKLLLQALGRILSQKKGKKPKKTKQKKQTPVMLPIFTLMAADVKLDNASMNFK